MNYVKLTLLTLVGFLIATSACYASDITQFNTDFDDVSYSKDGYSNNFKHRVGKCLVVRGLKLTPDLYLGQYRQSNKHNFGIVLDQGNYAVGIAANRLSLALRF